LEAKEGPFKGLKIRVPENNTFYAFASRCDMRNPSNILKVFELVSRYWLDQDAVGVVISWAFECYERGILSRKDTDWLDLEWGNDLAVIALIEKIGRRQGFGGLLGKGCKRASEVVGQGSEYYCTHLKGQDNLDAVRALKAWGLGNVVSLRGGRHLDGSPTTELLPDIPSEVGKDLFGVSSAFEGTKYDGKGKLVAWTSNFKAAVDSTGICYFATYWGSIEHCGPQDLAEALSAVMGRDMSSEAFLRAGERIVNIEKAFNTLHAGFRREDDYPPSIYMQEPIKTGQFEGELVTRDGHDEMLNEFYDSHGWDRTTSWQYEEALKSAGLPEVADKLREAGKLPQ
jgi:aldehyde:ferredoxin oxidoreductase